MSEHYAPPTEPWLPVLHLDRDMLVVDKPAGLLSVPGRQPGWRDSALLRAQRDHPQIYDVHRLDMDTSGVLVFALRRKAEVALKGQFADRSVAKRYLARVSGHPAESGEIDLPLRRLGGLPPRNEVDRACGKPARTRYRVIRRDEDASLLELELLTGRSHQLRVHLAAIGHPILGDRLYAPPELAAAAPRLALHAWRLELDHPYRGERLRFEAPIPALFAA